VSVPETRMARQNTIRLGAAKEIVLSPPLDEQVGRNCCEMRFRQAAACSPAISPPIKTRQT
jgi:hypothetical protein